MIAGYLMWRTDDGEATRALRRAMTLGFGVLFLALSFLGLLGALFQTDGTARLLSGIAAVLLALTAVRCARGPINEVDLALGGVATILMNATPDLTGSSSSFTAGTTYAFWLICAMCNLRPRVALWVLLGATTAYIAIASSGGSQSISNAFDSAVFTAGECVAGVGFMRALLQSRRNQDELTDEVTAMEIQAARRSLEQTSSDTVRRVLHDEVLSALRAVAELPADRRDQVVSASRRAALAVRQQLVDP